MIILLMLLYSVLASGTLPNFFGFSEEATTLAPVNNATAKVHHHHRHHRVKKVKRRTDIPRQTNYMTINIDGCPDVGYFFRREMAPNSFQMCHLCFCRSNGTAVCWPRDNKRCDKEHFHFHGAGKKRELPRSRRSPISFGDLFFRDATRDALNKQSPEECKPHENSYSEGCPPADWCVGCTICDCDANGRWDCHLLSFCSEEDKKRKKKNRGKTYVQKSVDGTGEDRRYKDNKQPENAQEEVQKLARLISQIGEKQARKYNGLNPRHRRNEERKNLTIAMMEPKRIPKAVRKQKANKLSQLQKQDQQVRKSSLKTNDNGIVVVRQKDDEIKEKYKVKSKENNDKAKILAKVNAAPKPLHPFNIKKKAEVKRSAQTSKPANKVVKPVRRAMIKKSPNKRPSKKNAINKRTIKTKKIEKSRKQSQIRKPIVKAKFMTKPIQSTPSERQLKTTTTRTTTTTTEDSSSSINVKPRTNKKPRKRQAPKQAQIDSKRLISDVQKKFQMRFMQEVDKLIEDEKANNKKIKRSAPIVKKIGVRKMVENGNRTKYQGVSKPVKRSSKVALDRSNKIKIYRSKREAIKENYFATLNSKWEVEYDTTINPTRVLNKTTKNVTSSTEPIVHKLKHVVDNTISAISEEYEIQYSGKLNAAKRSVDNQIDDLSVVRLDKEEINETFSVQSILNDTNGMHYTEKKVLVPTYAPIENKDKIIVINPNVASNHEVYDIFEDKVTNLDKATTIKTKVETNNTTEYIISDDMNKKDYTTMETTLLDYIPKGVLSTEATIILKNLTNAINVLSIDKSGNPTSNFTKHFENTSEYITELHDQVINADFPVTLTTGSDVASLSVLLYDNDTNKTTEWIDKSVVVINESYNDQIDMDSMPTSTTEAKKITSENFIFTQGDEIVNATNPNNIKKNKEHVFQTEEFSKMHSVVDATTDANAFLNNPKTIVTSDMYTNQKPLVTTDVAIIVKNIKNNYTEHPMTDYFTSDIVEKTENKITTEMSKQEIFTARSSQSTTNVSDRFNIINASSNKNTTAGNDYDFNALHFNTMRKSNENTRNNFSIKPDKIETTIKQSYDITFDDTMLVKPVSIQYLGNGVDKNIMFLNDTSRYYDKERKEKYSNKEKNESDRNVVLVLGKYSNSSTNSPLEEKSLHIKGSTIKPKWMDEQTTNTEVTFILNDHITTTDDYKVESKSNAELEAKNKISSYDVPKLTSRRKKHKLRKLVNTLYNKTNKDERYYVNNQNHLSKNKLDNDDFKHFFTKILKGINASKDNKGLSRSKVVKYLQKFFKNIFSSNKSSNRTVQSQIDKKNVINILCAAFGPCNINVNNKAKLLSKIDHLNSETYQMLRSIKIIKGLLKLVDIPSNDKNMEHRKITSSNFKSDVQKLHELLKDTYVTKEHLNKITDTQKTQIEYIKKTTHTFIQSAAKFIMVLNEIINIITLPDHKSNDDQLKFKNDKIDDKRNAKDKSTTKNNLTEIEQPLTKLKDLISKYTVIQNTFMKKIYSVISNLDFKNFKYNKTTEHVTEVIPNKTEAIKANTISIVQNLKKLKNLAENVELNSRKKRDLADDDSIEYLLMLMEYLLKQSHPLDVAPVNDGIDLLIEAIKSAPDIKSIKKKVLYQGINYNFTAATTTMSSEVNVSREDSNSVDNKISKEDNNTSNIEDTRFNIIDNTDDGEDEDDRFYYKRRGLSEPNMKHGDDLKPTEATTSAYAVHITPSNEAQLSQHNVMSDTVYASRNPESIEGKSYDKSNETEDAKYEPFNVDIEDEIVNLNSSEIIDTTLSPELNTHVYKRKMDNLKKNEDNISTSVGKSKLDWLDESYEEEIRSEVNSSASTRSPVKKNLAVTKKQQKINDISALSKEEDKMKKGSDEEVMRKKNVELLNSLDYVTQKSDVDASESKESNSEDKYSGDDGFSSDFR